jgi:hypothetical protein
MHFNGRDLIGVLVGYYVQRTAGRGAAASAFLVQFLADDDPLRGKKDAGHARQKGQTE